MRYFSTRGQTPLKSFSEAVEAGLAADGGLFLPETLPDLSAQLPGWAGLSYAELAAEFFRHFAPEIPAKEWRSLTAQAYAGFAHEEVAPLIHLDAKTSVLELFHGPTLAFKDFALQLLGLLYKRQATRSGRRLCVLGATSGDTGSAAIHGCLGQDGITIFILYPDGRVAPLQERQMACSGAANVFAIPVPGFFDDAQAAVKEIFADRDFANAVNLSAVNSINIARVLAQCVYYVWAGIRTPSCGLPLEFVVPTGNFGNVLAGWLAWKMRLLPADTVFRVATNQNDILWRFLTAGDYSPAPAQPSLAPSMDIQAASNFERCLYYACGENSERLREIMGRLNAGAPVDLPAVGPEFRASRMGDAEIPGVIRKIWETRGYLLDPHTACGFGNLAPDRHSIALATASPAKFPEVVAQATGQEPLAASLEKLKALPLVRYPLDGSVAAVKTFIRSQLGIA